MTNNNTKKAFTLSTEIANTMNEINNNSFSKVELNGFVKEYIQELTNNDTIQITEMLENELENGNMTILPLYKQVLQF